MRQYFWIIVLCTLASACGPETPEEGSEGFREIPADGRLSNADIVRNPVTADGPTDTVNVARISFEERVVEFGEVREGDVVVQEYRFTNTGRQPLVISDASSTCGCTVPSFPRQPIPPGETGVITVRFDTEGRTGRQGKPIVITANTYPATTDLYLNGTVRPRENEINLQ